MSIKATEAILPNWYDPEKFKGLIVLKGVQEGVVSLVSKYNPSRVKWTSDCKYCLSQMDSDFYPNHTAMDHCQSGKHSHCTCDSCF